MTVTLRAPPAAGAARLVGVSAIEPAACVTSTVTPAIVAAAVRASKLVVDVAESVTTPLPMPVDGLTVSHALSVEADQDAPGVLSVRVRLCVPPPAGALQVVGLTATAHCVTVIFWLPTKAVAVRLLAVLASPGWFAALPTAGEALALVHGAAVSVTLALAVPLRGSSESQFESVVALHEESVAAAD